MKTEIKVALIIGGSAIVAAIISLSIIFFPNDSASQKKDTGGTHATSNSGPAISVSGSENIINIQPPKPKQLSSVRIVDITFDETEEFPKVDIKLRNTGDEPAFIKQVDFIVTDLFVPREFREIRFEKQLVTWEYDVKFGDTPSTIQRSVSQSIPPNDTDRFVFRIAQEVSPPQLPMLARFKLKIIYDENNKTIVSEYLIVLIPLAVQVSGSYIATTHEEPRLWNIEQIKRFAKLTGKRSSWAENQIGSIQAMEAP